MYIDKYLPFLKKSPVLDREDKTIKTKDLFFPVELKNLDMEELNHLEDEVPSVFLVEPLGVYVMDEDERDVRWYIENMDEVKATVEEIDYHKVARFIEVDDVEDKDYAFYPVSNSFEGIEIYSGKYINYARNRISLEDEEMGISESVSALNELRKDIVELGSSIFEATIDDIDSFIDKEVNRRESGDVEPETDIVSGDLNEVEAMLDSYLAGGYVTERVPLLAGPTAVLKSATVKEIAKRHGYRMVDFRAAFMSRLDLEGLMERVEVDGKVEAFNAGMYDIIQCTDEFQEFCIAAIDKIDAKIEKLQDLDEDNTSEIEEMRKMREYYEEKAKPAVLFFDEVTRASTPIMNALTTILNQKEFLGYPMTNSRIIAATNIPVDLPKKYRDIYVKKDIKDPATSDRFQTIKVFPDTVEQKWTDWANRSGKADGKQNIHPLIMEILEERPGEKYNFEEAINKYEEHGDKSRLYTTAFPNYRTWDLLTNYIYKREEMDAAININAVAGLIGDKMVDTVIQKLAENGYDIEESSEQGEMDDVVEQGMSTGTPTMLLGPSSIGKCVTGDSIIRMKDGLKRIDSLDFEEGFKENKYEVDTISGIKKTSHTYRERSEIVKVEDEYGLSIKGTKNHPLLVYDDELGIMWKKINEIEEGDYLLSKRNEEYDVDKDKMAYLSGLFLGDGSLYENRNLLTIDKGKDRIRDLLESIGYEEYLGRGRKEDNFRESLSDKGKIYREYRDERGNHTFGLAVYNLDLDVDKNHFPVEGSYEYLLNYLAGYLDSDGYINTLQGYIEFGCESNQLINDLQIVLNSLGFKSRKYSKYNIKYKKDYYYLFLDRENSLDLAEVLRDLMVIKGDQLDKLLDIGQERLRGKLPIKPIKDELNQILLEETFLNNCTVREYRDIGKVNIAREIYNNYDINIRKIDEFIKSSSLRKDYIPEDLQLLRKMRVSKVIKKEKLGKDYVYDLTIPSVKNFIVNGICSHNTTRVKNIAAKYGVKRDNFIKINLAQQDAIDIMGPPTKVDLAAFAAGQGMGDSSAIFGNDSEIGREIKDLVKSSGLPEKTTIKAPKTGLASVIREAMANREKVVIFFDEFNRVEDDSVMTAVFEAVSDCFVGDTEIKMMDGTTKTIKEIHEAIQAGEEDIWVYSSTEDGDIKPGKVLASREIETDKRLVKVTLDNGEEEVCTEDHRWMLRDGSYVEAGELEEGDSLMPLYSKLSSKEDGDYIDGYEMVWDNNDKEWKMTHKLVAEDVGKYQEGNVVHHSDFDKRNNNPENLDCNMNLQEHIEYHGKHLEELKEKTDFEERRLEGFYKALNDPDIREKIIGHLDKANTPNANRKSAETRKQLCKESEEYRKSLASALIRFNKETAEDGRKSEWMKEFHKKHPEVGKRFNELGLQAVREYWNNEENREKRSKRYQEKYKDDKEFKERMRENAKKNNRNEDIKFKQQLGKINKIVYSCLENYGYVDELIYEKERKNICVNFPSYNTAMNYISKTECDGLEEVADKYNHKVKSVEYLDRSEPVYDITVDEHHNFALDSGVFVHNCRIFGVDFDPELVHIFAAANIGKEYQGASDFDPAFAARFNIYRKDGYDVHDVRNFKEWMEKNDYNQYLQDYINNKDEEEVLDIISQIDYRTLKDSVPSLRAFTDLNMVLEDDSEASKRFQGTVLFSSDKADKLYTDVAISQDSNVVQYADEIKELIDEIKPKMLNWTALDTDFTVNFRDSEVDGEDLMNIMNSLYDKVFLKTTQLEDVEYELGMLKTIIKKMFSIDREVKNQRKGVIKSILGEEQAEDFVSYYDMVSGTEEVSVDIPDLKDKSLISTFFDMKVSTKSNVDDKITSAASYYVDFYEEFGDSLPQENYQTFVLESLAIMPSIDSANNLLSSVSLGDKSDEVLKLAEKDDDGFVKDVMNKIGLPVKDEDIENIKSGEYTGPTPKMLGGND